MFDCRTNRTIGFDWFLVRFRSITYAWDNYMLPTVMMKKTFLNEAQYCWFLCDVKAAMSFVKNKNISLLGKYTLFFM